MRVAIFLAPWVMLGAAVLFVAFSGGPGRARQAYLTSGNRGFRLLAPLIFVGVGIAVPALIITDQDQALGGNGALSSQHPTEADEQGKTLFRANCASCHTLAASNARGITGPSLDNLGVLDEKRVVNAIRIGGTGKGQMPAGLLEGENAEAVGKYLARVAGR